MGTRCIVRVMDENQEILCLFRQFDGYPSGMGQEIADFCANKRIVNGYSREDEEEGAANGMGCLAAQLVKALKEGIGNLYVCSPGTQDQGEEYTYIISKVDHHLQLQVFEGPVTFFDGSSNEGTYNHIFSGALRDFTPEKCESAYHWLMSPV